MNMWVQCFLTLILFIFTAHKGIPLVNFPLNTIYFSSARYYIPNKNGQQEICLADVSHINVLQNGRYSQTGFCIPFPSHCKLGMLALICGITMWIQIFSDPHTNHTSVFAEPAHQLRLIYKQLGNEPSSQEINGASLSLSFCFKYEIVEWILGICASWE